VQQRGLVAPWRTIAPLARCLSPSTVAPGVPPPRFPTAPLASLPLNHWPYNCCQVLDRGCSPAAVRSKSATAPLGLVASGGGLSFCLRGAWPLESIITRANKVTCGVADREWRQQQPEDGPQPGSAVCSSTNISVPRDPERGLPEKWQVTGCDCRSENKSWLEASRQLSSLW